MPLDSGQKKYIAQNTHRLSQAELAVDLTVSETEIRDYLRKKWTPEKYQKYLDRFSPKTVFTDFGFKQFFIENKFVFLLLTFLVLTTYFNSIPNGLTSDDVPTIANEPAITNFFSYVFSTPFGFLQRLLYHFGFELGGTNPIFFRLPNIIFHLGATLATFLVLYLMTNRTLAIMTASLFAVHPILSESVTWISGGLYAQQGFFFLLSFAFYLLSKKNSKYYYPSIGIFLLMLTSSEKTAVLCLILLAYELTLGNIKENWKKLLPFFALGMSVLLFYFGKVSYRVDVLEKTYYLAPGTDSIFVKIPTSIAVYLGLLFWPNKLTLYHTEMVFTTWEYRGTVLIFLAYCGAMTYFFFRNNKFLSFWMVFFLIPLMPTLSPLRIAWAVAERYVYLGALGIIVLIAYAFYKLSQIKKLEMIAFMLFWLVVVGFSIRTIARNNDWKNEETLWTATAETSPSGSTIHNNMGNVYFQKGEYDKSIAEFQLAIQINPIYGDAYHNLGNVYYRIQDLPKAAESYRKALELNPRLWQSHQNLAAMYYAQKEYDLAQEEIKKALEINPTNGNLKKNLELIKNGLSY